ncbi:hypothetical protein TanjilG_07117 [Lupinus angustifolius]|uniref:Replication factor-A protein 1 N-terminal domain-containing protein n=1 Tax=Lupinus angustifolius TaxID=3871 RepID=A0A4P1QY32_LUPAN|nr:hypothetical protein TanjilG_07117 [Lupinus angustifolius]
MAVNLTPNAIPAIIAGDVNSKPLVQVMDITLISNRNNNSQQQRYRLLISDAVSTHHAMLATQLNDRILTAQVKKGSVLQLLEYICTPLHNRKIIVVLNMETIIPDCEIIGNPKSFVESDLPTQRALPDKTVEDSSRSNNNNNLPVKKTSNDVQNFRPTVQPAYQPPPPRLTGSKLDTPTTAPMMTPSTTPPAAMLSKKFFREGGTAAASATSGTIIEAVNAAAVIPVTTFSFMEEALT